MSAKLKAIPSSLSFDVDGDLVQVPSGTYNLRYLYGETRFMHNRSPKLVLWFSIADMGEHFGKKLARYYNVSSIKGKPGKNGNFKAGAKSDFVREYCSVVSQPVKRLDRIALSRLSENVIRAKVKTVTKGYNQRSIPEMLQYSVIEQIEGASHDY